MKSIVLIAHNLRSSHNVGSLLRTADGLGVKKIYLTGYTPYPKLPTDQRLPHIANKVHAQIAKTALGAEKSPSIRQSSDIWPVLNNLKGEGYLICALEQAKNSIDISYFKTPTKLALIIGREVEGVENDILKKADTIIHIPMKGKKESFNVTVAAAVGLYHLIHMS